MTVLPPGLLPRFLVESRGGAGVRAGAAAVLFADLSGFTALAERLSQQGPSGTEELSRLLNASFGPMVGQILDAGGDIVRFAGDAPIALFAPVGDESLGDVVRRAEACGQRLQLGLAEVARAEQIALTMRVTIAAGDVTRRVLGGHEGRFEWFVGGEAFAQLAATQAQMSPGEVTLTPAAQASLDASPAARETADAVTDEVPLRAFVSRGLLARLDAGHDDLLAERRLVSVLFVRLAGPSGEAEPRAEQLPPAFRALQRAVYSRGGSVNQFLRDDKGTVLVAAWGVPGCVHEDQAARAMDAAREGLSALAALGVSASAGVATGRVFCGWRGEPRRREYAVIGDVMNLAARLMTLEESGGRCDEATAQAARGAMRLVERAPVQLKGKAAPVRVYDLAAGSASSVTEEAPVPGSPLLGRDAEQARIAGVLDAATRGESAALLLTGEPGTGKTRLLDDAAATASGPVLRTGPSAIGAADAFHAWRPLLEQWIALPGRRGDPADLDARRTALDTWIAARPAARDAAALLRRLLQIADPDARVSGRIVLPTGRTTQELSSASFDAGDALRELLLQALEEFGAQGPVLLIVDEAHALDSLSLRVAHEALRRLPRLAVLFAARPINAGRNADLDAIAADPRVGQLVIGPLDAAAVESLVAHRLGVTRIPAAVARLVAERSGGNALFAGELAASLRDEGLLLVSDGTCRLTLADGDLATHRFPDSVQGVVAGRFDRLAAAQQLTLKVASVIGSVFALAALEQLHPVPASVAERRQELDYLLASGVLEELQDGVDRFAFRSTVMQEVAYGLLPVAQREAMHAAAADYFERAPSVVWAIVAHHRMRTADARRAIDALDRALEEAVADGADRETARAGERLIAYAAEGKAAERSRVEIARWIRQAAHARIRLGENRHGRTMIERALEELGYHVPHWRVTLVGRLLREMLRQGLHLAIPTRWRIGGSRRRAEVRLEAAVAAGHLPPLAFYEYDTLAYVTFCLVSVNLAEAADAPSTAGEGYAALGFIAATAGLTKLAERWWGIGEREGDALSRHNVMIARSLHLMARGDLTASEAMARRTVELARAARDWTAYEKGLWMVFSSRQTIGDVRGASEVTEALFASASGRDHRQHLLWAHVGRASVAMESGDAATAASECDAAEALIAGADPSTRLVYWTARLRHSVWCGDVERTKRDVVELAAILGPSGDIPSSLSRTNLADARLLLWDRATNAAERTAAQREARRLLQQLKASLRYVPVYRSRTDRFAGDIAWREGNADAARAHWQRAIENASNIPLDAAIAHLRLASHAVDTTSRRAHAESARQLLAPFDQRALLASVPQFPS